MREMNLADRARLHCVEEVVETLGCSRLEAERLVSPAKIERLAVLLAAVVTEERDAIVDAIELLRNKSRSALTAGAFDKVQDLVRTRGTR